MQTITTMIERIEDGLVLIKTKFGEVTEQKFPYAKAKDIRKAAQAIKKAAQDLRVATSMEYKSRSVVKE